MKVQRKSFKFCAIVLILLLLIPGGTGLKAASHREAPLIAEDPTADNTDVYAFRSPEDPSKVVIIANYIPGEAPAGGPNFYNFSPLVTYGIHIVNNFTDGEAEDDITFLFRFQTSLQNPATFLYNIGPLTENADPDYNLRQIYSVTKILRGQSPQLLAGGLLVPPNHVGSNSVPNHDIPAVQGIYTLPNGIRTFAGQRDEPFFIDLGATFDLLQLRTVTGANGGQGVDSFKGFNVHTIAMEIPINQLTRDGSIPTDPNDPRAIIGVYASANRPSQLTFPGNGQPPIASGNLQQVSRLANPLVNELIIPLGLKDAWNQLRPNNELIFSPFYLNPEVAGLLFQLFNVTVPITAREDLSQVFLTGVPGLTCPNSSSTCAGAPIADLLRLNVALPAVGCSAAGFNRLGVIGGDLGGFPNGRRVCDDVVDIALRAVAGVLVPGFNVSPNNALTDGVDSNDKPFPNTFPFLASPHSGFDQAGIKKVGEITYSAAMNGAQEVPPVTTDATGKATFTQRDSTVSFKIDLSSISGVIAAHIHSGPTGVNGPIRVFLFSGTTGSVNGTLVQGSFTAADVTGITFDDLINEMRTGNAYVNVHTTTNSGGEVRGQIQLE